MKELINKVYEEKMNDGTFEKIASEQFERMIKDVFGDVFGYNSNIRKTVKTKVDELMSDIIERSDFSQYVVKMQTVINEIIKNSSLGDYKSMLDDIKDLCGVKKVKYSQEVKISEILEEYIKYIEETLDENDFDDDEINTDDGTKNAYVECYVEVEDLEEEQRGYFLSSKEKKVIKLGHDKEDDHEETIIEFKLSKNYDGEYKILLDDDLRISDLRNLPSFVVYLLNLKQSYATIIIDKTSETAEAEFEFEWN